MERGYQATILRTMLFILGIYLYNFSTFHIFLFLSSLAGFYLLILLKPVTWKYVIGKQRDMIVGFFSLKCQWEDWLLGYYHTIASNHWYCSSDKQDGISSIRKCILIPHSILRIFARMMGYMFALLFLDVASALFVQTLFACYLVDYYVSFPKAALYIYSYCGA